MTRSISWILPWCFLLVALGLCASSAWGQEPAPADERPAALEAGELERREILEGRRWRRVRREFHDWLAVQQLYDADEVEQIKEEIDFHAEDMTAPELVRLMDDLEDRLEVLMSPEAEEARRWLTQFLAVQAKYSDDELRARRPNVVNMSADEIRREIEQLQRRRTGAQQAQAAFDRARRAEIETRRAAAAPRRPRPERPAPDPDQFRSRYAPRGNEPSPALRPRSNFWVDPDGNLMRSGWGF